MNKNEVKKRLFHKTFKKLFYENFCNERLEIKKEDMRKIFYSDGVEVGRINLRTNKCLIITKDLYKTREIMEMIFPNRTCGIRLTSLLSRTILKYAEKNC